MTPLDNDRWLAETDAFIRQFAERAERWDDHPDERLDVAYRSGIVPPARRLRR